MTDVRTLHPIFAAELTGVDCARPTPELVQQVESLMAEHAVLCIRGQGHLTDEQHLACGRAFGPLELPGPPRDIPRRIAYGLYDASNLGIDGEIIRTDSQRAKVSKGNELFHADSSFNDLPSKWSMLRGVIVTPEKGETELIDMRAVYDALPQAMKDRLEGLEAEHNYFHSRRKAGAVIEDSPAAPYMRAVQPMVRTSANGRKTLFVGAHAAHVIGMAEDESRALIEELLAFAAQPHFIYAHTWQQGDLLIWDNRCTLHRGTEFDYEKYRRDMRRCNVNESGPECSAIPFHVEYGKVAEPEGTPTAQSN
ncbi:MAG: alpha-ketoglutarate-dependent 2,4-dichlorophenoxyacetate dioxygenase [Pseudomonadota bacterium]|jgi:alpha-ketoglutarate-dependent 2,4-dichlorophenoxyacetate dioxygenase